MSRRKLVALFLIAFGCICSATYGRVPAQSGAKAAQSTSPKLTEAERALAANSRKAIISTGVSGPYFGHHFTLVRVVNQSGDRRVIWKFAVNGYETIVSDVIGYYTKDGKRIDTHGVAATLHSTSEIRRTISRRTANQLMQRCIGRFVNPSVEYKSSGSEGARLVFTAEAVRKDAKPTAKEREREREEREARERAAKSQSRSDTDEIRVKVKKGPPIIVGAIDLESRKCTTGQLR